MTDNRPMLNAYPDSLGGTLGDIVNLLKSDEMNDVFGSFYILPSIFNTDLDRGFSVINYDINKEMGTAEDIEALKDLGINLKLDFILNHISVLSDEFRDVIKNGDNSKYRDFFIDWNRFWDGCGGMTDDGYIMPDEKYIRDMFFRKPGMPLLMVRFPDGRDVPYWNTFYQQVTYDKVDAQDIMNLLGEQYLTSEKIAEIVNTALDEKKKPKEIDFGKYSYARDTVAEYLESRRKYLGQMDININSPLATEYYKKTLKQLAGYGAKIVRLDAFAYAPKSVGKRNFLNKPDTFDFLEKIHQMAQEYNVTLLPEIHASYSEKNYEEIAGMGYMTYDFFLPGLLLHSIEKHSPDYLVQWANELNDKKIRTVNMLGCHDGIPIIDMRGLLKDEEIDSLVDLLVSRGGKIKSLLRETNMYYQVASTYFTALGENEKKLLFARAVQIFMPGKPQVWYLDLFAGKNDYSIVEKLGEAGYKEMNRTNLTKEEIAEKLKTDIVRKQIELLRYRNSSPAFSFDSEFTVAQDGSKVTFTWKNGEHTAAMTADFETYDFEIR